MAAHMAEHTAVATREEAGVAANPSVTSFAEFYRSGAHAPFPQEHRQNQTRDLQLFTVDQGPHDLADAAYRGWILGLALRASCQTRFDYGHGWRQARRGGGDALLVPPNTEVRYAISGPTRLLVVTWAEAVWRELDPELFETPDVLSPLFERYFRSTQLEALCKGIWLDLARNDQASRLLLSSAPAQLAGTLLRCANSPVLRQRHRRADIRRALAYIQDNLATDMSLADIARAAGLSAFHFSREFHIQTGQAPISYVRAKRLELAEAMMTRPNADMHDIARRSGFGTLRRLRDAMKRKSLAGAP